MHESGKLVIKEVIIADEDISDDIADILLKRLDKEYKKAEAWDKTQKLLAECTHQDVTGDYVLSTFEFENRMEKIVEEYESEVE